MIVQDRGQKLGISVIFVSADDELNTATAAEGL
jgi:hypothetical protein